MKTKSKKEKDEIKKKKTKAEISNKQFLFIVSAIFIIIILFLAVFGHNCRDVQEAYTIQVPYTAQECKQIPYLIQECKQIPYQVEEPYTYYLTSQVISDNLLDGGWKPGIGCFATGYVKLKNIDDKAGWFTVTYNWKTLYDSRTSIVRHYIEPDETITFSSEYDIDCGEDITYSMTRKSDPLTKTKWVTKYREECNDVTKYKTETKYKTVTRCDVIGRAIK